MSELDPSTAGTGRLRRRSFYENMEPEPSTPSSTMDTISLDDNVDGSSSSSTSIHLGGQDHPSSSAPLLSSHGHGDGSSSDSHSSSSRGGLRGLGRSLFQLLAASLWYVKAWFIVKWQALEVRTRLARTLRRGTSSVDGSTETLVVKQYAYPTHWIKLACVSLVVFQWTIYAHWQHTPLTLHVEECVYNERMLPPVPLRERILAGGGGTGVGGALPGGPAPLGGDGPAMDAKATANVAAMRYLERRFELLHAPAKLAQHNSNPRLPWTCVAIVPTLKTSGGGEETDPTPTKDPEEPSVTQLLRTQAQQFSLLLPRSQIVQPSAMSGISSRVHLALASGSEPIVSSETSGVLATMFPLASFRASLFPRGFPDVVLVKSEYALKKLVLYRHERQEEFQHRIDHHDGGAMESPRGDMQDGKDERLRQEKSKTQFGVYLLKTTVPDIYNRHIRKDWDAFLHVVVVSEQDKKEQLTKEILALWLHHPEWPTLYIRFQQSLPLCQSFLRYLSTMRQVTGDDAEIVDHDERHGEQKLPPNIDITCDVAQNTHEVIIELKNRVGLHLFPVPPEMEVYEDLVLESAAAGALVITYNTPIMHEWITDKCGIRVGSYENKYPPSNDEPADVGLLELPEVHVASGDIERAVEGLLKLDRVHRVAAGRAARVRYLAIRTHFLSAIAALDRAICDSDSDDALEMQNEIGQRSRKKVDVDSLRVFLY